MVTAEYLEELGFKTTAAAGTATEAMNKLRLANGAFGAAIIDVGLPDRRGDVLVTEIRADPSLPIVIATGYQEEAWRARYEKEDRIIFLTKPYGAEQLRTVLAPLMAGR